VLQTRLFFMPERWIAENSIVIQEIAHNFKMMKKGRVLIGFQIGYTKSL